MAQNVQMPLFSSASGLNVQSYWGDVDNLDVDMLAEYLLDDTAINSNGVSFDFPIDSSNLDSNMISPEESVDGNSQAVDGSSVPYQASAGPYIAQQLTSSHGTITTANQADVVYQTMGLPQMQNIGGVIYQNIPVAAPISNISPIKRRRLENGEVAAPTGIFNGQQSAAFNPRNNKRSPVQVDRRRERNRILARRTRLRKKFFFESLQKEVMDLQRENEMLKEVVRSDIGGSVGMEILDSCDAVEKMPPGVLEACAEGGMDFDSQDFNLVRSIQTSQQSFIITDPSLTDNPIVFASDGFLELTGYQREQVLGRNCRFLQGTDTNKETIEEIRKGIAMGEDVSVTILNYTADGTPFWNKQFIAALRDAHNNVVNYVGVVVKVASPEPGHPDFGKFATSGATDTDVDGYEGKMLSDTHDSTAAGNHSMETTLLALEDSVSAAVAAADRNYG